MASQSQLIDAVNIILEHKGLSLVFNEDGVCSGLAALYIKACLEGKSKAFFSLIEKIVSQDPISLLEDGEVNQFIRQIEYSFHLGLYERGSQQYDIEKFVVGIDKFRHEYTLALTLTKDLWSKYLKDICHNDRAFYIGSNGHAIAVYRENNAYYVYDPNYSLSRPLKFELEEALINELIHCFHLDKKDKQLPLSIKVYAKKEASNVFYPKKKQLLSRYKKAKSCFLKDETGRSESLSLSVAFNDIAAVKAIIEFGGTDDGVSLALAAHKGYVAVLSHLLSQFKYSPTELIKAIKYAAEMGHLENVKLLRTHLAEKGVPLKEIMHEINATKEALSLLQTAAKSRNPSMFSYALLLTQQMTVDSADVLFLAESNSEKQSALSLATKSGAIEVIDLIVQNVSVLSKEEIHKQLRLAIKERHLSTITYWAKKYSLDKSTFLTGVFIKEQPVEVNAVLLKAGFLPPKELTKTLKTAILKGNKSLFLALLEAYIKKSPDDKALKAMRSCLSGEGTVIPNAILWHGISPLHLNVISNRSVSLSGWEEANDLWGKDLNELLLVNFIKKGERKKAKALFEKGVKLSTGLEKDLIHEAVKTGNQKTLIILSEVGAQIESSSVYTLAKDSFHLRMYALLLSMQKEGTLILKDLQKVLKDVLLHDLYDCIPFLFKHLDISNDELFKRALKLNAARCCYEILDSCSTPLHLTDEMEKALLKMAFSIRGEKFVKMLFEKKYFSMERLIDQNDKSMPLLDWLSQKEASFSRGEKAFLYLVEIGLKPTPDFLISCLVHNQTRLLETLKHMVSMNILSEKQIKQLVLFAVKEERADILRHMIDLGLSIKDIELDNKQSILTHIVDEGKTELLTESLSLLEFDNKKIEAFLNAFEKGDAACMNVLLALNEDWPSVGVVKARLKLIYTIEQDEELYERLYHYSYGRLLNYLKTGKTERQNLATVLHGSFPDNALKYAVKTFDTQKIIDFIDQGYSISQLSDKGFALFKRALQEEENALLGKIIHLPDFKENLYDAFQYAVDQHKFIQLISRHLSVEMIKNELLNALEKENWLLCGILIHRLPYDDKDVHVFDPHKVQIRSACEDYCWLLVTETPYVDPRPYLMSMLLSDHHNSALDRLLQDERETIIETILNIQRHMKQNGIPFSKDLDEIRQFERAPVKPEEENGWVVWFFNVISIVCLFFSNLFSHSEGSDNTSLESDGTHTLIEGAKDLGEEVRVVTPIYKAPTSMHRRATSMPTSVTSLYNTSEEQTVDYKSPS